MSASKGPEVNIPASKEIRLRILGLAIEHHANASLHADAGTDVVATANAFAAFVEASPAGAPRLSGFDASFSP